MKKTLQRELKCPSQSTDGSSSSSTNNGSNVPPDFFNTLDMPAGISNSKPIDDVNHTYLKHVLIKFLTSREYEVIYITMNLQAPFKFLILLRIRLQFASCIYMSYFME